MTPGDGDDQTATRAQRGSQRLVSGRYLLHEVLGRGGMGTVWRAHDQLLDRPVAAKELHLLAHGDDEHRVRMRRATREARAVARVSHPHVVGVHDLVESDDRLWIVMELVEGPSLAHRVAETGPLTPQHTAALGLQLLDALEAVHAAGALHRDVKPANVLLRRDGNAVLTDFGIAALDDGEFLTGTGQLVGSLEYMAPERVTGAQSGPASDLWSLGATLATVCCGQSPFRRPGGPATLHAVAYEEPVLPERLGPLRPVVEALLRKSPDERPSAAGARSALWHVAAGGTGAGPLPSATVRVPLPSAPLGADADTVTSGHERPVRAGETVPTAGHDASHPPSPHQPPRPAGPKGLWWASAGAAVLSAGAVGGLFLTGVLPFEEDPATTTVSHVVQSATGWQPVNGVTVERGDRVTVRFVSGEWTADHRSMPMTGPAGYDAATNALLDGAKNCKVKAAAPFGTLLAVLTGDKKFPVRSVGQELTFKATGNGTLHLGMNDAAGSCSSDNRGALTVKVSITHRG
ncbi:serine/threonine-protein kinase [Streptomyces europaeiscabiei]|uniref:serine/threonine-protein kinase n=1 Tax=Streptomyces europaeiscabiei TaxID=146819 RepID=UPI002E13A0B7|nr:serine/threonine protein kinase [Streptomyces europaeiscabiei]